MKSNMASACFVCGDFFNRDGTRLVSSLVVHCARYVTRSFDNGILLACDRTCIRQTRAKSFHHLWLSIVRKQAKIT